MGREMKLVDGEGGVRRNDCLDCGTISKTFSFARFFIIQENFTFKELSHPQEARNWTKLCSRHTRYSGKVLTLVRGKGRGMDIILGLLSFASGLAFGRL